MIETGDTEALMDRDGVLLGTRVYNELKQHARSEQRRATRTVDKRDRATAVRAHCSFAMFSGYLQAVVYTHNTRTIISK